MTLHVFTKWKIRFGVEIYTTTNIGGGKNHKPVTTFRKLV